MVQADEKDLGALMKIRDIIQEGGWDTTHTQGTVITPQVVRVALQVMQKFAEDFNAYLKQANAHGPIKMGRPTGSTAHHEADVADPATQDKVYGDIDLQMIGPELETTTQTQYTNYWNGLVNDWLGSNKPAYVHSMESIGHPIIEVGPGQFVQVDLMWHPSNIADWGAARVTPERGIKGLLMGNMFSVLGQLLDMSIQHAGVQLKTIDGEHVPFSKQKGTELVTLSTNPGKFILDILGYEAKQLGVESPQVDPMLKQNPGTDANDPKIERMVRGVQGLAKSFEANGMFGQGDLRNFTSAEDFMQKFEARYEEKAFAEIASAKRDKATTPQAIARAEDDKKKVMQGLKYVKGLFAS